MVDFDPYRDRYDDELRHAVGRIGDPALYTEIKARVLVEIAARFLGPPIELSVLDVGCGPGLTDAFLTREFGSVAGVDVSRRMVERAREANPGACYEVYDGGRLPFETGSFDLTFAICVFHHVEPPSWQALAAEILRVTRSGGLIAVLEHNPLNPLTRMVVARCEFDDGVDLLGIRKTKRLLTASGAKLVASKYIVFFPWHAQLFRRAERAIGFVPFGAQYLVVGRRP